MTLQIPSDVSKITLGGETLWDANSNWKSLKLSDGVIGTVIGKVNRSEKTISMLGSIWIPANSIGVTIYGDSNFKFSDDATAYFDTRQNSWNGATASIPWYFKDGNLSFHVPSVPAVVLFHKNFDPLTVSIELGGN